MIAKHREQTVADVYRESGKQPAHLGMYGSKSFQNKWVRRSQLRLKKTRHLARVPLSTAFAYHLKFGGADRSRTDE